MITRRNFLKGIAGTMAALSLSSLLGCGEEYPAPEPRNNYHMAIVVVSSTEKDTDESVFRIAKIVGEQFPPVFNEATGNRVTFSTDPTVYEVFRHPSYITNTDNDLLAPAEDFVEKYDLGEQFDFITLMFGFDTGIDTHRHLSIFNTNNRVDNDDHPSFSADIGSRVIGLNALLYTSCEQCDSKDIQEKVTEEIYYTSHETLHQWAANLNDYIDVPLVIKGEGSNRSHYNGTLSNLDDILNMCEIVTLNPNPKRSCRFWEPLGNSNYRMSLINDVCSTDSFNVTISDLTLWAMEARKLDELTQTYLLVTENNPDSYGHCFWPNEGTMVTGRMVTAKEIILNHLEARE